MIKLKNVKKLLGEEVYSLWLENVLRYSPSIINTDASKYLPRLHNLINGDFDWEQTPQGYEYWQNIHDTYCIVYKRVMIKYWASVRRPLVELKREHYKKSWYFRKKDGRTCIAYLLHDNTIQVHAGCFEGTLQEFEAKAFERYGNNTTDNYAKHIVWLKELQKNTTNPDN